MKNDNFNHESLDKNSESVTDLTLAAAIRHLIEENKTTDLLDYENETIREKQEKEIKEIKALTEKIKENLNELVTRKRNLEMNRENDVLVGDSRSEKLFNFSLNNHSNKLNLRALLESTPYKKTAYDFIKWIDENEIKDIKMIDCHDGGGVRGHTLFYASI